MLILFLVIAGLMSAAALYSLVHGYVSLLSQLPRSNADFQCFLLDEPGGRSSFAAVSIKARPSIPTSAAQAA